MNFRPRAVPVPPFAPKGLAMAALAAGLILAGCVRPPFVLAQSPPMPAPPAASAPNSPRAVGLPRVRDYEPISELRDIYFDFGKAVVRPSDVRILDANAAWLRANPDHAILVAGHADARGTSAYNLALAERRALTLRDALVARGVRDDRISVVTYGEGLPSCRAANEPCWSTNRTAVILVRRGSTQTP